VLGRIDQLAREVSSAEGLGIASRDGGDSWYGEGNGVSIADSPELVARLTVEAVRVTIQVAVEQLQQIANDPVMLHEWIDWQGIDGVTRALVVQHKASGLPARLHPGHFIQPAKIADLFGYLLGASGRSITGQRLVVCAGASL
jgi:hypothetical protein